MVMYMMQLDISLREVIHVCVHQVYNYHQYVEECTKYKEIFVLGDLSNFRTTAFT